MQFNEKLKNLRLCSTLMQKEIAQILNVSVRTFQGWESGRTEPNIEKLIQIAHIFNVSLDELLCQDDYWKTHEADVEKFLINPPMHPNG